MPILLGILAAAGAGAAGTPYWLARWTIPEGGNVWGQDIVRDSSSNLYLICSGPNYDTHAFIKIDGAGALAFSKRTPSFYYGMDIDSTGVYHGMRYGDNPLLFKNDLSGNAVFGTLGSRSSSYGFDVAVASSGNIYRGAQDSYFGPQTQITKYNSSGVRQWEYQYSNGYAAYRVDTDSSENVYYSAWFDNINEGGPIVGKVDTSGTFQWARKLNNYSSRPGGIHVDSSNNIYAVGTGVSTYLTWIWKLNTSGTISITKGFNAGGSGSGNKSAVTVDDSTGNVYVMSGSYFLAFDSSLNLLWQRQLTGSTIQSGGIVVDSEFLYFIGSYGSDGSNTTRPLIGKLPKDGSFAGLSTTLAGTTLSFSASSGSLSNGPGGAAFTMTRQDNGWTTSSNTSIADVTSTVTVEGL